MRPVWAESYKYIWFKIIWCPLYASVTDNSWNIFKLLPVTSIYKFSCFTNMHVLYTAPNSFLILYAILQQLVQYLGIAVWRSSGWIYFCWVSVYIYLNKLTTRAISSFRSLKTNTRYFCQEKYKNTHTICRKFI